MSTINQDFLHGFAEATGLTRAEAETEWSGFSYQLSTEERENLENGGSEAGRATLRMRLNLQMSPPKAWR